MQRPPAASCTAPPSVVGGVTGAIGRGTGQLAAVVVHAAAPPAGRPPRLAASVRRVTASASSSEGHVVEGRAGRRRRRERGRRCVGLAARARQARPAAPAPPTWRAARSRPIGPTQVGQPWSQSQPAMSSRVRSSRSWCMRVAAAPRSRCRPGTHRTGRSAARRPAGRAAPSGRRWAGSRPAPRRPGRRPAPDRGRRTSAAAWRCSSSRSPARPRRRACRPGHGSACITAGGTVSQ